MAINRVQFQNRWSLPDFLQCFGANELSNYGGLDVSCLLHDYGRPLALRRSGSTCDRLPATHNYPNTLHQKGIG